MSLHPLVRTAAKRRLRPAGSLWTKFAVALSAIVIAFIIPRAAMSQTPTASQTVTAAPAPMRGWVGVAYTTSSGELGPDGALMFRGYPVIESIEPNSPAERAGLEAGDTILAMNAQDLKRTPLPMAAMVQPGRRIVVRFKRADAVREVTLTVAPRPRGMAERLVITMRDRTPMPEAATEMRAAMPPGERGSAERGSAERGSVERSSRAPMPPMPALPPIAFGFGPRSVPIAGAELTGLNSGLRSLVGVTTPGIFVVNVALGTPASESGLEPADVIVKADGEAVGNPGDLIRALRDANGGSIRLQIVRKKKAHTITLRW